MYNLYKFLIFIPISSVATIISATMTTIVSTVSHRRAFWWGQWWARVIQTLLPMKVSVTGRDNIDPKQSYVIVANHQSAFDIIAIYANIGVNFRWIMKQELRKTPLIGWACSNGKHIFIDRSSKRASYRSLQRAKAILQDGISVVVFPEGTRSYSNSLKPFKNGAVKLALQLGLPILPITLKDTHKIMGKSFGSLKPGAVSLVIHEPISQREQVDYVNNPRELVEKLHSTISKGLI